MNRIVLWLAAITVAGFLLATGVVVGLAYEINTANNTHALLTSGQTITALRVKALEEEVANLSLAVKDVKYLVTYVKNVQHAGTHNLTQFYNDLDRAIGFDVHRAADRIIHHLTKTAQQAATNARKPS